jgi:hypothetical protein
MVDLFLSLYRQAKQVRRPKLPVDLSSVRVRRSSRVAAKPPPSYQEVSSLSVLHAHKPNIDSDHCAFVFESSFFFFFVFYFLLNIITLFSKMMKLFVVEDLRCLLC